MAATEQILDTLASLAIFADLGRPELEHVAHELDEQYFPQDQRVLRQGLSGSAFYLVLEGEAAAIANGVRVNTLARGDFFGEISVLLGEPPSADVVAVRPLRCLVLAGERLEHFLVEHPRVTYRILQAEARKLRNATRQTR
ncbi:MAG TPA: cyclic nucleotide-binding domain-containing protein [Candidatus Limnocylindria bacterium]|nr:cyclic nucleotide-binding domain-containing protein [Candidatus Limnocylindria bacterium]